MAAKHLIACRPNLRAQMEAAFPGLPIVIDENITDPQGYEFRERELDFEELLEEEVDKEERLQADPKQAQTLVIPLGDPEQTLTCPWLTIRLQPHSGNESAVVIASTVKLSMRDGEPHVEKIMGEMRKALVDDGWNVLSISEGNIAFLADR